MRKDKAISVSWIDSIQDEGWQTSNYHKPEKLTCKSVGFLVFEDKEVIILSSCLSPFGGPRSPITIPKFAITQRKFIKL